MINQTPNASMAQLGARTTEVITSTSYGHPFDPGSGHFFLLFGTMQRDNIHLVIVHRQTFWIHSWWSQLFQRTVTIDTTRI
jgi:hypothetical protein